MEAQALLPGKGSPAAYLLPKVPKTTTIRYNDGPRLNYNPCCIFANGYSSSSSSSGPKKSVSVIVRARKKSNKEDAHSAVPKPEEVFFPEAVLLKKRTVEEDGKLLPEFADAEERQLFENLMLESESTTKVELMRHYEVVYLIHEKHEEEVAAVNKKVENFLGEKKGRVWRFSDWGMRRLAYKIKKAKRAHYILMNFELDDKYIDEFKSMLDRDERVIRHLVIKRDEAITEDCPPPPEFHTLSADADDYEEEEYDTEYDEEDYDDDEMDGYDDDGDDETIVYGDDDD